MLQYIRNIMSHKNDEGASAVEYGLLVAAIAALIVIVIFALGGVVKNTFKKTCDAISGQGTSTGNCAS